MPAALKRPGGGPDLFEPARLGAYRLANRVVMAPLTRGRASDAGVPGPLMARYYGQRASAGLIIAEGTNVSAQGRGYAQTPGLFTDEQIEGWRLVTFATHARSGRMFVQLWHVGRDSHPSLQPGGALPVAPSAIRPEATIFTTTGFEPCVTPRALASDEIPGIVEQYREAAHNAKSAHFDGVEIHAANGCLLEQFLRDSTNQRTDAYGGTRENRARLLLEVTEAVVGVWGGEYVGIRLSPLNRGNEADLDSDPAGTYGYVVERLNELGLAYIHVIEGTTQGPREVAGGFDLQELRRAFKGLYMANNGYDLALALEARRRNLADLISFGRPFIANPDLVERLRSGAELNIADHETFFSGGSTGYTDYPELSSRSRA